MAVLVIEEKTNGALAPGYHMPQYVYRSYIYLEVYGGGGVGWGQE